MKLSPLEDKMVRAFGEKVRGAFGERLRALTLFGSRARGQGHEESDLDILVIIRDLDLEARRRVQDLAADLTFAEGIRVSPFIRDETFDWSQPIGREIARDGVAL